MESSWLDTFDWYIYIYFKQAKLNFRTQVYKNMFSFNAFFKF